MSEIDHMCPVCGYGLGFEPWDGNSPSDEICPCCGIQFGYTDMAGGNLDERERTYREWREQWVASGMRWKHSSARKPPDWNPTEQLKRGTRGEA